MRMPLLTEGLGDLERLVGRDDGTFILDAGMRPVVEHFAAVGVDFGRGE